MLEARVSTKSLLSGEILLRDVAVAVRPGDIVALLGASGVGKTTLLRILLGLDRNFQGAVRRSAQRVGAVFQEPRLLPWRTIGDNIRLVAPRGRQPPDVAALLREVELPDAEHLYPRQVSLGMARRAALARALAIAPDLLILDEPFASLDPGVAALIAGRLIQLPRRRGAALVFAMHDIARATALATTLIVLAGRPATVACRAELAADADAAARAELQRDVMRRFPFLADATGGA
ncbi:MAG: ATP-binding cassette domain-containing protein [Acetobacteraceae bacterium]|nr:ATP-binding cassette domain-containing protein [Acetobacteraceae bacterium]